MLVDHLGVVVRSIEKGIEQWTDLFGYTKVTEVVINTRQQVKVVFLEKKDSLMIKLIEPASETSPIYNFAKKGGGLHHLCFRCNDLETQIPVMEQNGARCIVKPQPGEAFMGHDIAFLLARNNLNVELIDTKEKEGYTPLSDE